MVADRTLIASLVTITEESVIVLGADASVLTRIGVTAILDHTGATLNAFVKLWRDLHKTLPTNFQVTHAANKTNLSAFQVTT